jgi:hypothetical protein
MTIVNIEGYSPFQSRRVQLPPRLNWYDFINNLQWKQGEHIAIIGPTGCGKTTLMHSLFFKREWNLLLAYKPDDDIYHEFLEEGWQRARKWPPPRSNKDIGQNVLLWPRVKTVADLDKKAPVFEKCLQSVFTDGGWTVGLDDLYYIAKVMRHQKLIETLNYNVRSVKVSLIAGIQRPAWIPRSCWDQSSHAFLAKMSDTKDVNEIHGLSNISTRDLTVWLKNLRPHEWLYLPVSQSVSGEPAIVMCPPAIAPERK